MQDLMTEDIDEHKDSNTKELRIRGCITEALHKPTVRNITKMPRLIPGAAGAASDVKKLRNLSSSWVEKPILVISFGQSQGFCACLLVNNKCNVERLCQYETVTKP